MAELHHPSADDRSRDFPEPLTFAQDEVLKRAVAKVVLLGDRVGVSADQMIGLLESGLTVPELLVYLAAKNRAIS